MFVVKFNLINVEALTIALGQITFLCLFISFASLEAISVRIWICLLTFIDLCPNHSSEQSFWFIFNFTTDDVYTEK